jgi:hypothetical protein
MQTTTLKQIRSEARTMTLDALREAHANAVAAYAMATTREAAQHHHDAAGEYAEAYQNATAAGR